MTEEEPDKSATVAALAVCAVSGLVVVALLALLFIGLFG